MASNDSDPSARGTRRPVIGLTTYLEQAKQGVWDVRAAFLPQQYFTSVTSSGGIAVLLPPQDGPDDAADETPSLEAPRFEKEDYALGQGVALGNSGSLPPALGAFLPDIICGIAGVVLVYRKMQ